MEHPLTSASPEIASTMIKVIFIKLLPEFTFNEPSKHSSCYTENPVDFVAASAFCLSRNSITFPAFLL